MSIRRVLAIALRIVRQFLRDRRSMALLFGAPLLVMTILNFVLNGTAAGVTLGIVAPEGAAGGVVMSAIEAQLGGQPGLTVKRVARGDVEATLKSGDADGVLVLPAALGPGAPAPTLRLEGSDPAVARQVRQVVGQLVADLQREQQQNGALGGGAAGFPTPAPGQPQVAVSYLYGGPQYTETDAFAPFLVGLFAFFFVFLLASVAFLRERTQGTIERLMVSPLAKSELVLG